MKLLRHPPLLAWLVVSAALLGVLLTGWLLATPTNSGSYRVVDPTNTRFDVIALRDRAPVLVALSATPTEELHRWASDTASVARADQARAKARNAGPEVLRVLGLVATQSDTLSRDSLTDTKTLRRDTFALLTTLDELVPAVEAPSHSTPAQPSAASAGPRA